MRHRPSLSVFPVLSLAAALVAGCDTSAAKPATHDPARSAPGVVTDGAAATTGGAPSASSASSELPPTKLDEAPVVRALYVNRFAAQSAKKFQHLVAIADSTEVNGLVLDLKDEFGLNYVSKNPAFARNGGSMGKLRDVKALVDTMHAHRIVAIARIVVFKDSVTARVNPQWTIRRTDGSIWRDHKGLAWVNPYHRELWDYNIGVAEELAKLGFDEIQFDYIRFPEPYKSLPQQVFPEDKGQSKPDAIAEFLRVARGRLSKLGVRTTADIFGLVTTVKGPLEVAQEWEKLAPVSDVLLPMVYPSHYPPGSFGIARPNADPYKVIFTAIKRARERDVKLGITGDHVRPWLQAFTLGKPEYGANELREQKRAVYDAGYDGWVMWSPGSKYDIFVPGLEKTLVSRRKGSAAAAAPVASAPASAPGDSATKTP